MRRTVSGLGMGALFGWCGLVSTIGCVGHTAAEGTRRAGSEVLSQIGIERWDSVPLRDRGIFRGFSVFCVGRGLMRQIALRKTVNRFRLRGLAMHWRPAMRIARLSLLGPGVRRFGTTRAFVLSGHEYLEREPAVLRNAAMGCRCECFAAF